MTMKKIVVIFAIMLLTVSAFSQDGKSLYAKYSDHDAVEAVYISPAMFRMIGKLPDMNVYTKDGGQMNLAPIVQSLTGFYLLSTADPKLKTSLDKDVADFAKKGRHELLMEAKDHGEVVRIYTTGDDTYITSLVVMAIDGEDTSFICLDGKILRSDLEDILVNMENIN